jgi:hypothetical protein
MFKLAPMVVGLVWSSPSSPSQGLTSPVDVTVCVADASLVPRHTYRAARATATWMFARIGVRIAWLEGRATVGALGSPIVIQLGFAGGSVRNASPGALAYASPFEDAGNIVILWDRIRWVARSWTPEHILAHALAHEIGHVLQGSTRHSQVGVMKADWEERDLEAMERRPLPFTTTDIDLIKQGLNRRKARAGYQAGGPT